MALTKVTGDLISDGAINFEQINKRFTGLLVVSQSGGTFNLDTSKYSTFRVESVLTSSSTLNIQNMRQNQVIDITLTGSQTITLTSNDDARTFNKLGSTEYSDTESNHLQVLCLDETGSAAIYNYSISTYTSDTTP